MAISNFLIKSIADEFKSACMLVNNQGGNIVSPLINLAAVAIELYLKALSSDEVLIPDSSGVKRISTVYAKPKKAGNNGHGLVERLKILPAKVQTQLISSYLTEFRKDFETVLLTFEGAFQASRYSYEVDMDISKINIDDIVNMVDFLSRFVEHENK